MVLNGQLPGSCAEVPGWKGLGLVYQQQAFLWVWICLCMHSRAVLEVEGLVITSF